MPKWEGRKSGKQSRGKRGGKSKKLMEMMFKVGHERKTRKRRRRAGLNER